MKVVQCKCLIGGKVSLSIIGVGESNVEVVFTISDLKEFIEWKNTQPESTQQVDETEVVAEASVPQFEEKDGD